MNKIQIYNFIDYLKLERRLSKNTCDAYMSDLLQFNNFINKEVKDMSKLDLENYITYLQSAYKENSYLRKVAAIKSFNKYLKFNNQEYNKQIELLVVSKREKRLPKFLTQAQIEDFLNQFTSSTPIESRDKAMFETLYSTGMRVSEMINIDTTDVNIENGTIRVVGKGNKERIVILNKSSIKALENYIYNDRIKLQKDLTNILFLNNKGKQLTRQGFNFILKKYANAVNINDISPHIFRHSIATHMLNNGGDLRMIQMLLGHSNISTTEVYTHVSKEKIFNEYAKMHPLAKEGKNEKV